MVATDRRIAILAPMPSEMAPLVRVLSLERSGDGVAVEYSGRTGGAEIVAARTGIGTKGAAEATERILGTGSVDHLLVVGIAGGVPPGTKVGDLVVPELVVNGATGSEHRPSPLGDIAPRGTLSTSDEFLVDEARLAEMADRGVVAVDMETAAIGAVCEAQDCAWSVFRGISDMAGETDDEVINLAHPDGSPNLPAAARYLLRRPWKLPGLTRLARDATAAAKSAAEAAAAAISE